VILKITSILKGYKRDKKVTFIITQVLITPTAVFKPGFD
jgi:hypothetical protein